MTLVAETVLAATLANLQQPSIELRQHTLRTNNNTAQHQHHVTITHIVLDLPHRLELLYGKQQTSRRSEMRDIETILKQQGVMEK